MIKLKFVLALSFMIGAASPGMSQQTERTAKADCDFKILTEAGIIIGSNSTAGKGFITGGWQKGKYFAGASAGVDTYFQTSIPLLLQGRYRISEGRNPIQLVLNGGINPAIKKDEGLNYTNKAGSYFLGGVQVFFNNKKSAPFLSVYYAQKQIIRNVQHNIFSPIEQGVVTEIRKENYLLRGVQVGLGWQW